MSKPGVFKSTFGPEAVGDCPSCGRNVLFLPSNQSVLVVEQAVAAAITPTGKVVAQQGRMIVVGKCGACGALAVEMGVTERTRLGDELVSAQLIFPKAAPRPAPPPEVPGRLAADYVEASICEPHSKRAAAALGRRCLQSTLSDAGFAQRELNDQLKEAQKQAAFGSELIQLMDALRLVGNYAVHPKNDPSGDPLHVEDNEVEAIFGTLDELFDVLYVQKARRQKLLAQVASKTGQTLKT